MPIWTLKKKPNSVNHQEITEAAILQATAEACKALAEAEGNKYFPLRVRLASETSTPHTQTHYSLGLLE